MFTQDLVNDPKTTKPVDNPAITEIFTDPNLATKDTPVAVQESIALPAKVPDKPKISTQENTMTTKITVLTPHKDFLEVLIAVATTSEDFLQTA